jgi:RNA polymerase sigma-70 factor (ECF subfamily)
LALPLRADAYDAAAAHGAALDARRVGRVLRGDADAYGELVQRHMRRAFSVAYRILEQREDAEDVVQDSFIRALERLDRLDRARPFRPWLLRIVVNQALNYRRGRAVRATSDVPASAPARGPLPDRAAERSDLRSALYDALAALPEKQRTIVQLADIEGLSSAEIGIILDIADGTVRWHLHEARRTLRAALAPIREES